MLRQTGTDCVLMDAVASINHMIRPSFFWGFIPSFLILRLLGTFIFLAVGPLLTSFHQMAPQTVIHSHDLYVCVYIFVQMYVRMSVARDLHLLVKTYEC